MCNEINRVGITVTAAKIDGTEADLEFNQRLQDCFTPSIDEDGPILDLNIPKLAAILQATEYPVIRVRIVDPATMGEPDVKIYRDGACDCDQRTRDNQEFCDSVGISLEAYNEFHAAFQRGDFGAAMKILDADLNRQQISEPPAEVQTQEQKVKDELRDILESICAPEDLIERAVARDNFDVTDPANADILAEVDELLASFNRDKALLSVHQQTLIRDLVTWVTRATDDKRQARRAGTAMVQQWAEAERARNQNCWDDAELCQVYAEQMLPVIEAGGCVWCKSPESGYTCFDCGITLCKECYVIYQKESGKNVLTEPSVEFVIKQFRAKAIGKLAQETGISELASILG